MKFPVFSLYNRELGRDEFARDCLPPAKSLRTIGSAVGRMVLSPQPRTSRGFAIAGCIWQCARREWTRRPTDRLAEARNRAECLPQRPRVFFEEWDAPLISAIEWVSELVEIAGGIDIFADRARQGAAKDRVVTIDEVVAREPDLIIGSWCGKKFRPERVMGRPGFEQIRAVQHQDLYEIKSPLILPPGPAALTAGLAGLL